MLVLYLSHTELFGAPIFMFSLAVGYLNGRESVFEQAVFIGLCV